MLDFHSHLIPGVDDGAESLDEALSGLQEMRSRGITEIITTPHFRASSLADPKRFEYEMGRIDAAWETLVGSASTDFPELTIRRGVELALDEPVGEIRDSRVRLGGSRFVLVEFPGFSVPPNSGSAITRLWKSGLFPIIAHPERYQNVHSDLNELREWKRSGALLQLNAGSVIGAYGNRIQERAWRCVANGLVDYISSDYHSRGECLIARASAEFRRKGAEEQFKLLGSVNGDRLLAGLLPVPVQPHISPKRGWRRFFPGKR